MNLYPKTFISLALIFTFAHASNEVIVGEITHVRDGDTFEIENIQLISCTDCLNNTPAGRYVKSLNNLKAPKHHGRVPSHTTVLSDIAVSMERIMEKS